MKKLKKPSKKLGLLVVVLVVIVAVGVVVLVTRDSGDKKKAAPTTTANLSGNNKSNLLNLATENSRLTNKAIDAMLDGSPDANAQKDAAYANAKKLGAAMKALYGPEAEATFNKNWKAYMDQSFAYATASKNGDEAGKATAAGVSYSDFAAPLAQYLHKINPVVTELTVRAGLQGHFLSMATMSDDHVQGKLTEEQVELKQNSMFLQSTFTIVADGIKQGKPAPSNKRTFKKL